MNIPDNNLPIYFQKYSIRSSPDTSVLFSTLSANPSNVLGSRVWNFVFTAIILDPDSSEYVYDFDLKGVDDEGYQVSFEGGV